MGWLLEILGEIILSFIPWGEERKSRYGESKMDRQARWIGYGLLAVLVLGAVAVWWFWK